MKKLLIVVGTRPELIKVAGIVKELEVQGLRNHYLLINSSQHKELLDPYWAIFGIKPDVILDVMKRDQNLSSLTVRVIDQFQQYLDNIKEEVGAVLAQGDTTTVFGVSLVSFYNGIPFYHLEAGLRSFDLYNPYPEEFNRKAAGIVASFHFCPTETSKENLEREGVDPGKILVAGNTVIDSLLLVKEYISQQPGFEYETLRDKIKDNQKTVLITCHRRENHGDHLKLIISAISELANENKGILFVWILHPNPKVMDTLQSSDLFLPENIFLVPPVGYNDLIRLLSRSTIAISDSGGIQEEAPSFNVPVLVLRNATERPEGVEAGAAVLVGTDKNLIKEKFYHYLSNGMNITNNPYGDGLSSGRIVKKLIELLGI